MIELPAITQPSAENYINHEIITRFGSPEKPLYIETNTVEINQIDYVTPILLPIYADYRESPSGYAHLCDMLPVMCEPYNPARGYVCLNNNLLDINKRVFVTADLEAFFALTAANLPVVLIVLRSLCSKVKTDLKSSQVLEVNKTIAMLKSNGFKHIAMPLQPHLMTNDVYAQVDCELVSTGKDSVILTLDQFENKSDLHDFFNPTEKQKKALDPRDTFFRCLGYDKESFYLFQNEKRQIMEMKRGDFSESGLLALAPKTFWLSFFPNSKGNYDRSEAVDWIFRRCYSAGVFRPDAVRGLGAWVGAGRLIYHFGSHLQVNGDACDVTDIESKYTYELTKRITLCTEKRLTSAEGQKLLDTAMMFRWTRPASAPLLCGWLALSRLCGSLRWRPHVWITGESGSGKSTIMDRFIFTLIGHSCVFAQGNSTEAGIRQQLATDALPVLFDESEQNNEREHNRVQNILALIRQASSQSGAVTYKGTVSGKSLNFDIRSMFMLSSVQVNMLMQADRERITVLALKSKRQENAADQWKKLESSLIDIGLDETIGDRLFNRSLHILPTILKNVETFRIEAARFFGTVREGDQYGTMLAGCWSLCNDVEATAADAKAMLESLDWDEHTVAKDSNESEKTLATILERKVRTNLGELTLYEVINTAKNGMQQDLSQVDAKAILERHGMRIIENGVVISNNSNAITEMLKGSQYQADWRGQILRIDGINKYDKTVRINGVPTKCIILSFAVLGV